MNKKEKIKLFEACGAYCRAIVVLKGVDFCFECKKQKDCLIFDSSDGEYSQIIFCFECLNKFGKGFVSNSTYGTNDLAH